MIVCPDAGEELDVALPDMVLEAGARLPCPTLRAFVWGSREDHAALARREPLPPRPTVLVVHGLTQGARAAGEGGFWEPLVGTGRPLRPWAHRIVSFNLLGSCRGSTGPASPGFPTRADDARFPPPPPLARGAQPRPERELPATITPRDQAAAILLGLDALGVDTLELAAGGSLGGMVVAWLAVLAGPRLLRALAIATPFASTAWMIGWNHVAREAILGDPGYPSSHTGLAVARQIARMTYRSERGLAERQGRRTAGAFDAARDARDEAWSPRTPYRMETYLRHAGATFDFDPRAYVALTLAMDHHDLARAGDLSAVLARFLVVAIEGDRLVEPEATGALADALAAAGVAVETDTLRSRRGHDALFAEWGELTRVLRRALAMPPGGPRVA